MSAGRLSHGRGAAKKVGQLRGGGIAHQETPIGFDDRNAAQALGTNDVGPERHVDLLNLEGTVPLQLCETTFEDRAERAHVRRIQRHARQLARGLRGRPCWNIGDRTIAHPTRDVRKPANIQNLTDNTDDQDGAGGRPPDSYAHDDGEEGQPQPRSATQPQGSSAVP